MINRRSNNIVNIFPYIVPQGGRRWGVIQAGRCQGRGHAREVHRGCQVWKMCCFLLHLNKKFFSIFFRLIINFECLQKKYLPFFLDSSEMSNVCKKYIKRGFHSPKTPFFRECIRHPSLRTFRILPSRSGGSRELGASWRFWIRFSLLFHLQKIIKKIVDLFFLSKK